MASSWTSARRCALLSSIQYRMNVFLAHHFLIECSGRRNSYCFRQWRQFSFQTRLLTPARNYFRNGARIWKQKNDLSLASIIKIVRPSVRSSLHLSINAIIRRPTGWLEVLRRISDRRNYMSAFDWLSEGAPIFTRIIPSQCNISA